MEHVKKISNSYSNNRESKPSHGCDSLGVASYFGRGAIIHLKKITGPTYAFILPPGDVQLSTHRDTSGWLVTRAVLAAICGVFTKGQILYYLTSSSQQLHELGIIIPVGQMRKKWSRLSKVTSWKVAEQGLSSFLVHSKAYGLRPLTWRKIGLASDSRPGTWSKGESPTRWGMWPQGHFDGWPSSSYLSLLWQYNACSLRMSPHSFVSYCSENTPRRGNT